MSNLSNETALSDILITVPDGGKACPDCGKWKGVDGFGRNATLSDGMSYYCLSCNRRRAAEHYRRRRESAGYEVREADSSPEGFKRCAQCRETKPKGDFHAQKTQSGGLNSYCKSCRKAQNRAAHLMHSYGLTEGQRQQMVEEQGGLCAICKTKPAVHVDHDHTFDEVRGVLCFTCNVALGHAKDDIQLLQNMIDYLERTTWQRTLVSAGVYQLTSPPTEAASRPSSELHSLISSRRS